MRHSTAASHKRTLFWGSESVTLIGTNTITAATAKKYYKQDKNERKT